MSRGMIPQDLFRIQWGFDARLSPYGRLVACSVTRIRKINGLLRRPPGRTLPSAPASGHVLPTALVAPPAHYGRTAAAARSTVDRGLDTHLGMG
jgi:hypothetical protein